MGVTVADDVREPKPPVSMTAATWLYSFELLVLALTTRGASHNVALETIRDTCPTFWQNYVAAAMRAGAKT